MIIIKGFAVNINDNTKGKSDRRPIGTVTDRKISTLKTLNTGTGTVTFDYGKGVKMIHKFTVLKEIRGNYYNMFNDKVEISTILHSEEGSETIILNGDILIKIEPALSRPNSGTVLPSSNAKLDKNEEDSYQEQEDGTYIKIGDNPSKKLTIGQIYEILKTMRKTNEAAKKENLSYSEVILTVELKYFYPQNYKVNILMARNVKK